jgi:hypothetical protein
MVAKYELGANDTIDKIFEDAGNWELPARFLIVGVDAHRSGLYTINGQLQFTPKDCPGFAAIGSGEPLAIGELTARCPRIKDAPLANGLYHVYEAKKAAERDRNVGETTDMVVLQPGREPLLLGQKQLDNLDEIYKNRNPRELSRVHAEKVGEFLRSISAQAPAQP